MLMKSRLHGAQKGHGLLKKKADALQMRFRLILGKIIEVYKNTCICVGTFLFPIIFYLYFYLDKNSYGRSNERGSVFIS